MNEKIPAELTQEQQDLFDILGSCFKEYKTETEPEKKKQYIRDFKDAYVALVEQLPNTHPVISEVGDIYDALAVLEHSPDDSRSMKLVNDTESVLDLLTGTTVNSAETTSTPESAAATVPKVPATETVPPAPAPEAPPVVEPQTPEPAQVTSEPAQVSSENKDKTSSAEKDKEVEGLKAEIARLKEQNKKIEEQNKKIADALNDLTKASTQSRNELLAQMKKLEEQAKTPKAEAKPTEPVKDSEKTEAQPKTAPAEAVPKTSSEEKPASPESGKEKVKPSEIFTEKNKIFPNYDFEYLVRKLKEALERSNASDISACGSELEKIADEHEFASWREAYGHTLDINFNNPTVDEADSFIRQYETYKAHREIFFKSEGIKSELVTFVNMSLMDAYKSYIPLTKEDAQELEGKLDDLVNPQELDLSGEDGLREFRQKIEQVNRIDASMQNIRMKLIPEFDKAHRRLFAEARFLGLEEKLNAQAGFEGVRPGSAERMIEVLDTMLADADSLEAELSEHKTKGMKGTRQEAIAGFFAKYDGLMNAFGLSGPDFFQAMRFYLPGHNVNAFKEKIQEIRSVVDSKKKTYREAADSLKNERRQIIETLGAQEFIARVAQEKVIKKLTKARNAMFKGIEQGGQKLEADSALAQAELARTFEELGDDPSDVSGLGEILKNASVKDVDGNMTAAREARINQGNAAIGQMIGTYLSEMSATRNKEFQGFMSLIDGQLKRDKFGEEKEDKKKTIIAHLRQIQLKLAADKADDRVARRKREYVKRAIDTLEARIDPAKVKGARTK